MTDVIFIVSIFRIITELEMLKKEAAEVQRKMEETDTVMAEPAYCNRMPYCNAIAYFRSIMFEYTSVEFYHTLYII